MPFLAYGFEEEAAIQMWWGKPVGITNINIA